MKKWLVLLAVLALAVGVQAKKKVHRIDVIKDKGFHTTDYSKLKLGIVSNKDFLRSIEHIKHYDSVAEQADDINLLLKAHLGEYCKEEFQGGKKGGTLVVDAILTDFNAGSAAAAVWGGYGAGNGHCTYEFRFYDGDKEVAAFEITERISRFQHGGWGRQDISGSESRMKIPKMLVDMVDKFLADH